MAQSSIPPGSSTATGLNLEVLAWSKRLIIEAFKQSKIDKFIGESANNVIQIKDELNKGAGSKITIGLRMQGTGPGVAGDATLTGNEEPLALATDALLIDQLRNAVLVVGDMSQQRVTFDMRAEGKSLLSDWWAGRIDSAGMNQLCGNAASTGVTGQTDLRFTGSNATIAPQGITAATTASSHAIVAGYVAAEASISTNGFDLKYIDTAVGRARTMTPAIKPIKMSGMEAYVMFIHPYQTIDLRKGVTSGQWLDIQKAAMQGGEVTKNPIFTGALGMYNQTILHEDARVTWGDNTQISAALHTDRGAVATQTTSVARAVFCGQQAGAVAFGRASGWPTKLKWIEVLQDFENQYGVAAGMIWGLKKLVFTPPATGVATDLATITVSSFSPGQ